MTRPSIIPLTLSAVPAILVADALQSPQGFNNVTLQSPIMSARVFMPSQGSSGESKYYSGSRFEHGSMIGDIYFGDRSVYGRGLWRTPHDPQWPESGVGLASEFGCGDNGVSCVGKGEITNGVLGYDTAKAGEPFLKIGVGALIKGSCPDCVGDENGDYRFNSPYKFLRTPTWNVLPSPGPNEVTFVSEETVGDFGYRIQKTARLDGNVLTVRSLLTNLGKKQFTTPWYSHHFFTGDNDPVGPGYNLELGLSEFGLKTSTPFFRQPGLGLWSGDINEFGNVTMARDGSISINMKTLIPDGVKLKANFLDESIPTLTDGSFTLHAPNGISVYEKIPELQTQSRNPFIYAYNVYAEKGTFSPEPMLLLYLQPGETTFWTQHLKFTATDRSSPSLSFMSFLSFKTWKVSGSISWGNVVILAAFCMVVVALYSSSNARRRLHQYSAIPDHSSGRESGTVVSVV